MRLYHVTDRSSAEAIITDGFQDAEVIHDDSELLIGVWLADRCLADEEDVGPRAGPVADVALLVELSDEIVERYEHADAAKPYREFCVPAALLNDHPVEGPVALEDIDPASRRRRGRPLEGP
jgi:hypothetical protein